MARLNMIICKPEDTLEDINPGVPNRIFLASDTGHIFFDDGLAWRSRHMTPRGAYSAITVYRAFDLVTYQGSAWLALADLPAGTTPVEGASWTKFASKGDQGDQGIQGIQGEPGDDGTDGRTIHTVTGAGNTPGAGLGANGDIAINPDDDLYFTKASGSWSSGTSMIGPEGPPGPGAPDATTTVAGLTEKATAAEAQSATDTGGDGSLYIPPSVLAAEITRRLTPEAWNAPTLTNSWVNFGAPYEVAGYMKDPLGFVCLKGQIRNGTTTAGTTLFTLPVGYRPAADVLVGIEAHGVHGRITITSAGAVQITSIGGNSNLSLESIRFKAA